MMTCNLFIPQVFWFRWCRQTPWFVLIVVTFVNVGMWYERFVIIVQSLHHDFLPESGGSSTRRGWTGCRCSATSACSSP